MEEETAGVQKEQCHLKLHSQIPWWLCGWSSRTSRALSMQRTFVTSANIKLSSWAKRNLFLLPHGEMGWRVAHQHLLWLTSVGLSEEGNSVEIKCGFSLLGKIAHVS